MSSQLLNILYLVNMELFVKIGISKCPFYQYDEERRNIPTIKLNFQYTC